MRYTLDSAVGGRARRIIAVGVRIVAVGFATGQGLLEHAD
jgi:hypothetical protein